MDKTLPSDYLLLQHFKADIPGAFEKIYNAYVADLLDYASRRLVSLEEARDLVQDIFADLYERKDELEIKVSLRAYLFTALKYKIIDHIRKNVHKKYYAILLHSAFEEDDNSFFNNLVYKDLNNIMDHEIQRLPSRMREVFLLSRKKHLSISEIAKYMDVSEQTVKNQISSAITKLRPTLDKLAVILLCLALSLPV